MTDIPCGYHGDRDAALVAYLYDDITPMERASFDAHLASCQTCRGELVGLQGVRAQLARWAPPEPVFSLAAPTSAQETSRGDRHRGWWRDVPAWAQAAAALLLLGVSAGIANLDVRYDRDGLTVRTGWSRPAVAAPQPIQAPVPAAAAAAIPGAAPWRAEMAALERQVRELRGATAAVAAQSSARPAGAMADAEVIRRVQAIVDAGEKRQQRELALRLAEMVRDVDSQRRADLVKIDRSLGQIQNNTGVEVLKQRELLNYLVRASSQK